VLLSFAQFEREVTAERIRDKIAASKKKGLWMGGTLPLGYDRHPDPLRRELVVNPTEAEVVKSLFHLYEATSNLRTVERAAARLGLRPKAKAGEATQISKARSFSRGQLHYLLTNPTYLGRIRHRTQNYPGLHPAIIDQALWDSVQAKLQSTSARPRGPATTQPPERFLMGKLRDETGDLLTPTHTERRGRKYGYYISHRLIRNGTDSQAWRLSAPELEATLRGIIAQHLTRAAERHTLLTRPDASDTRELARKVAALLQRIAAEPAFIGDLIENVVLHRDRIALRLAGKVIAVALGHQLEALAPDLTSLDHAIILKRRGVETRIVAGDFQCAADPVLIRVIAEARIWAQALRAGTPLMALAVQTGHSEPYLRARLPLAFLSPKLQAAILDGKQSPDLSVARLIVSEIPLDWAEQERLFG
jgi:site-specific DNA recombinase